MVTINFFNTLSKQTFKNKDNSLYGIKYYFKIVYNSKFSKISNYIYIYIYIYIYHPNTL
jgi:hypothetical protein